MASLTDLPLLQLCHSTENYDYDEITKYAHGVGVPADWIMNQLPPTDDDYSKFIEQMHDLDLAVHPYTDQDDHLKYKDTVYDEAALYVNKGVDGLFVEFPHSQYVILQHLGTKANFPSSSTAQEEQELNIIN